MKTNAKDVFFALYESFHRLDAIKAPKEPEPTASNVEVAVYEERLAQANEEVAKILEEGAKLLDRYVDNRIKKIVDKMKYDGDFMAK